jgi:hypothetical protein
MKKSILLIAVVTATILHAQSWTLNGNAAINASTNFLGTTDSADLVLKTNNTERIRISSTGNVGIGISPDPNIAFRSQGRSQFFSSIDSDTFVVRNTGSTIMNGASLVWLSYEKYQPNNPGILDVTGITYSAGNPENILSVKANGKVILGPNSLSLTCSDCNNYRMFVKDGIRTEKIKVDIASSNGWADYVFEKNYNLMPLNELESFISQNKHLPEVPTTNEAIENGIELKEMNILLLKKIEELTLYVIQQQKEIQELKVKLNKMKDEEYK